MSELDQELGNYYIYIVWFRLVRFSNIYNFCYQMLIKIQKKILINENARLLSPVLTVFQLKQLHSTQRGGIFIPKYHQYVNLEIYIETFEKRNDFSMLWHLNKNWPGYMGHKPSTP
jgi:hypothetical protein